jgi:hypothetical protein
MTPDLDALETIRRMRRRVSTIAAVAGRLVGRPKRFVEVETGGCDGGVRRKERGGIILRNSNRSELARGCSSPQVKADLSEGFLVKFDDGATEWRPWSDSMRLEDGRIERRI